MKVPLILEVDLLLISIRILTQALKASTDSSFQFKRKRSRRQLILFRETKWLASKIKVEGRAKTKWGELIRIWERLITLKMLSITLKVNKDYRYSDPDKVGLKVNKVGWLKSLNMRLSNFLETKEYLSESISELKD